MVTRPAVPPYSSTTIATWVRRACMSRISSSAGLESGTKKDGRITVSMRSVVSASCLSKTRLVTSLR